MAADGCESRCGSRTFNFNLQFQLVKEFYTLLDCHHKKTVSEHIPKAGLSYLSPKSCQIRTSTRCHRAILFCTNFIATLCYSFRSFIDDFCYFPNGSSVRDSVRTLVLLKPLRTAKHSFCVTESSVIIQSDFERFVNWVPLTNHLSLPGVS